MRQLIPSQPKALSKDEAEQIDTEIVSTTEYWRDKVGPLLLRMRDEEGWKALGHDSFKAYASTLDERIGVRQAYQLLDKATVERNIGHVLPLKHALQLARLPDADAQQAVFDLVVDEYAKPIERNFQVSVDRWIELHTSKPPPVKSKPKPNNKSEDGWSDADLEDDAELKKALDRIQSVYGTNERHAIQDGTVPLSREDIVGLARFSIEKMKEVQFLIMANHWNLEDSLRFVNARPDRHSTVEDLINHCIGTRGFFYVCAVDGYDISIKACKALEKKLRG